MEVKAAEFSEKIDRPMKKHSKTRKIINKRIFNGKAFSHQAKQFPLGVLKKFPSSNVYTFCNGFVDTSSIYISFNKIILMFFFLLAHVILSAK